MSCKRATYSGLLVAIAIWLSSCTQTEWVEFGPIAYEPVVKAMISSSASVGSAPSENLGDTTFPKTSSFGVWVLAYDEKEVESGVAPTPTIVVSDEEVRWNGSEWNTYSEYLWPEEKMLSVAAYAPAEAEAHFSHQKGVVFNNVDVLSGDSRALMFASPTTSQKQISNQGVINIPFVHALSSVQFNVIPHVPSHVKVRVKSIKASNIFHKGSFSSLPQPLWIPQGESYEQTFFDGSVEVASGETKALDSQVWVLPQGANVNVKLVCDLVYEEGGELANQTFEVTEAMNWKVGREYTYTIKVYMQGIGFMHDIISGISDQIE